MARRQSTDKSPVKGFALRRMPTVAETQGYQERQFFSEKISLLEKMLKAIDSEDDEIKDSIYEEIVFLLKKDGLPLDYS